MTSAYHGTGVGHDSPDPINCNICSQSFFHDDSTVQTSNTSDSQMQILNKQKATVEQERQKQQETKREQINQTKAEEIRQSQRAQEETKYKKRREKFIDDLKQQIIDLTKDSQRKRNLFF